MVELSHSERNEASIMCCRLHRHLRHDICEREHRLDVADTPPKVVINMDGDKCSARLLERIMNGGDPDQRHTTQSAPDCLPCYRQEFPLFFLV